MNELSFGQSNSVRSILKELAQQIQDLSALLDQPENPYRILPVTDLPDEKERRRLLKALSHVRENIEAMCRRFDISFEPFPLTKKLTNIADYMYVVALELRSQYLKGYGELTDEAAAEVEHYANLILDSLKEL
jgi:hypothetical protein